MKKIMLTNTMCAVVDGCDYDRLFGYVWSYVKSRHTYYASRRSGREKILMHREIMGATTGQYVDHRDGDGLNNVRDNLRICTHSENLRNQQNRTEAGSSRFRGVSLDRRAVSRGFKKTWKAYLTINYKYISLGMYATEVEAARAYDAAAKQHYGEFAVINYAEI